MSHCQSSTKGKIDQKSLNNKFEYGSATNKKSGKFHGCLFPLEVKSEARLYSHPPVESTNCFSQDVADDTQFAPVKIKSEDCHDQNQCMEDVANFSLLNNTSENIHYSNSEDMHFAYLEDSSNPVVVTGTQLPLSKSKVLYSFNSDLQTTDFSSCEIKSEDCNDSQTTVANIRHFSFNVILEDSHNVKKDASSYNHSSFLQSKSRYAQYQNLINDKSSTSGDSTGEVVYSPLFHSRDIKLEDNHCSEIQVVNVPHCPTSGEIESKVGLEANSEECLKAVLPVLGNKLKTICFQQSGYPKELPLHQYELCLNKFSDDNSIFNHTYSLLQEGKSHVCDICNKQFTKKGNLKIHYRVHTKEKPYVCILCNKRFSQSSTLRLHHRTHTDERPYMCDICGKSFANKIYLGIHQSTHRKEKAYKCDACDKRYTQRSSLNEHKLIHNGTNHFICEICHKSYSHRSTLRKHYLAHSRPKCLYVPSLISEILVLNDI